MKKKLAPVIVTLFVSTVILLGLIELEKTPKKIKENRKNDIHQK